MSASPFIITFASPKGGVGKSTTCLAIAAALASRGEPVLILDLDQTNTLIRWYRAASTWNFGAVGGDRTRG